MKRAATLLLLSLVSLTVGCQTTPTSSSSTGGDVTLPIDQFAYHLTINGEGTVKAYKDGHKITEENFQSLVNVGDKITLVITPGANYVLQSVKLNGENLILTGANYTFTAINGSNDLEVTFSEIEISTDDFTFIYDEENLTASISNYSPSSTNDLNPLIIPDELEHEGKTYLVTSIEEDALTSSQIISLKLGKNINDVSYSTFDSLNELTSFEVDEENQYYEAADGVLYSIVDKTLVKVPLNYSRSTVVVKDGTLHVGDYAFNNVNSVASVDLNEGLLSLGNYSFYYCQALRNVEIPYTLKSIGDYCFRNCQALLEIDLNEGLETIGIGSFFTCGLESIDIPSTVKEVTEYSFYYCRDLAEVTLHEGTVIIGMQAFITTGIREITFPSSLTEIHQSAFDSCTSLTKVNFSEGLEVIGDRAFFRSNNIEKIELPSTLKEIGVNPFAGIIRLGYSEDSFTIKDNDNFEIVDNVLYSKGDEPTLICYPYGKNDSSFRIKDGTKVIGEESFYFDIYVTDITIPTSVTTLNYCFISMYSDSTGASSLILRYEGTVSEFSSLDFVGSWHESTSIDGNVVICSDGNYSLPIM